MNATRSMLSRAERRRLLPIALALTAFAVRAPYLSRPSVFVFDESFYANDALDLLTHGAERGFAAHPPVGKWMIAVGIRAFGFSALGWRFAPLLVGCLVVALSVTIMSRHTTSLLFQAGVGVLVIADGIAFTTGRLALLDGLVSLWTTILLLSLTTVIMRGATRRDALVVGAVLGVACATKWSALPLIPIAVVILALKSTGDVRSRLLSSARCLTVGVLIYVASFGGWILFGGGPAACDVRCPTTLIGRTLSLWRVQVDMATYHSRLTRTNHSLAPAWTWVLQTHPAVLLRQTCDAPHERSSICGTKVNGSIVIDARGSPVLWAAGTVSVIWLAATRRRRSVAVVTGFAAALWVPWLILGSGYSFYGAPLVPVLAVATGITLSRFGRYGRWAFGLLVAGAVAQFVVAYPTLTGMK